MPHLRFTLPPFPQVLRRSPGPAVRPRFASVPAARRRVPPPVYVINLASSRERWARIAAQLAGRELAFERLAATDGRTLSAVARARFYDPELNRRSYHRELTAGEIGCYASHLRAAERLLASGAPWALVLEDDIVLGENFSRALNLVGALPAGWDLVKLGAWSRKPIVTAVPLGGLSLCRYRKVPISGYAYAISRAGAEKLLRARRPFGRPFDVDLQHVWETGHEIFGLEPFPVRVAGDVTSDIQACSGGDAPARDRVAFALGRLRFASRMWAHCFRQYGWWPTMRSLLPAAGV